MALTLIENESVIVVNTVVENTTIEVIEEPKQVVVTESGNIVTLETLAGAQGEIGPQGPQGIQGIQGEAATIDVGTTETVAPDQPAEVTNSGTVNDAVLNFKVPQGIQGEVGESGYLVEVDGTYPDRPSGDGAVTFVGETNPDLLGIMLVGDTWINTAVDGSGAPSYLQGDATVPVLATNLVNNPRFVKTSGDVLVQESLLGYGGSTPAKNAASAPMVDLDELGTDGFVYLNGSSGNYISTPDNPALDITGDIDIHVKVGLDGTSSMTALVSKWGANNAAKSWIFWVYNGNLRFEWQDSVGAFRSLQTPYTFTTSDEVTVRAAFVAADAGQASVSFYSSEDDGLTWALIQKVTGNFGSSDTLLSNEPVRLGSMFTNTYPLKGRIYAAQVRNGIDGTVVANFDADDFADKAGSGATATDSVGNVWTLAGTETKVHTRKALWLPGTTGNYVSTPDKNELDFDSSTFENGIGKWEGLNKNLLTANQSSFETDTTGWATNANSTVSRTTVQKKSGAASLAITATAAGDASALTTPATNMPVIPGQVYTVSAEFLAATTPRQVSLTITWRDSTNTTIGSIIGTKVADNSVGWQQAVAIAQAPANAAYAFIIATVHGAAAGEVHYVDAVSLMETPNANLIPYPDFENGITGYTNYGSTGTPSQSTADAYTGTTSIRYTTSSPNSGSSLVGFPTVPGTTYTISAYIKRVSGTGGSFAIHAWATGGAQLAGPNNTSMDGTWQRVSTTFTATTTQTTIYFAERSGAAVTWHMDAVQLVKGSTAVPYLPPKTTNLHPNPSFEVNASGWTARSNSAIDLNSSEKYVGSNSLKVSSTAAGNPFGTDSYTPVEATPDTTYTFSVYVKAGPGWSGKNVKFVATAWNGNSYLGDIGFSTITLTDAWQRVSVTAKTPANTTRIGPSIQSGAVSSAVGDAFYVDALQIEHGSVATPYVDGSLGAGYSWDSSNNLHPNPSLETNIDFWGSNNSAQYLVVRDTTVSRTGSVSLRIDALAGNPSITPSAFTGHPNNDPTQLRVLPNTTYTFSCYVRAAVADLSSYARYRFFDSADVQIGTAGSDIVVPSVPLPVGTWTRIVETFTTPANADHIYVSLGFESDTPLTSQTIGYLDDFQLEQRPFATPYGQTGTAHASTSTRQTPWVLGGSDLRAPILSTANKIQGSQSLLIHSPQYLTDYDGGINGTFDVNSNTQYTISAWTLTSQGADLIMSAIDAATGVTLGTATHTSDGAIIRSLTFTTGASTTKVRIAITSRPEADEYRYKHEGYTYIDAVQLEKSATATAYVPPLRITGDIDIRAKVALEDWTPGAVATIIGKAPSPTIERSFILQVLTNGRIRFLWYDNTNTLITADSTTAPVIGNGQPLYLRSTLDVDNSAAGRTIRFYTSTDGVAWEQLGTDVVQAGATSVFSGTGSLMMGAYGTGGTNPMERGKYLWAQVRAGIDGAVVAEFNAAEADAPGTTWTDTSGREWTINRSGDATAEMVDRNTWVFTGSEVLQFPDRPELDFGAGEAFTTVFGVQRRSMSISMMLCKGAYTTTGPNYMMGTLNDSRPFARSADGADNNISTGGGGPLLPVGQHTTYAFTRESTGTQKLYVGGVEIDSETGTAGSLENSTSLFIGRPHLTSGNDNYQGAISWVAILRRVLTTDEHTELGAWNGSIATEPVWLREAATLYVNADDALTRQLYRDYNYVYNLADGFTGDTAADETFTYQWSGTPYQSTAKKNGTSVAGWLRSIHANNAVPGAQYLQNGGLVMEGRESLYNLIYQNLPVSIPASGGKVTVIYSVTAIQDDVEISDFLEYNGSANRWYSVKRSIPAGETAVFSRTVNITGFDMTTLRLYLGMHPPATVPAFKNNKVRINYVMALEGDYFGEYFDGDSYGAQWTGTAHDSPSQKILVDRSDLFEYKLPARTDNALLLPDSLQSSGWKFSNTLYLEGTGFPEGVVTAPVGSRYIDTAATNGAVEWVKASGTGNTGWKVAVGSTGLRNISTVMASGFTGTVYLRRIGDIVTMIANSYNASAVTVDPVYTLPLGFRVQGTTHTLSTVGGALFTLVNGNVYGRHNAGTWHNSWLTSDPWPTILPGTPA